MRVQNNSFMSSMQKYRERVEGEGIGRREGRVRYGEMETEGRWRREGRREVHTAFISKATHENHKSLLVAFLLFRICFQTSRTKYPS